MRRSTSISALLVSAVATPALAGAIVSDGETFDFRFYISNTIGQSTTVAAQQLQFTDGATQTITDPGGYGFFGDIDFNYAEVDLGGGEYAIVVDLSSAADDGFFGQGLLLNGYTVRAMFFDIGDFAEFGSFQDGLDTQTDVHVSSATVRWFADDVNLSGLIPAYTDGPITPDRDLVGWATAQTGNDIGAFGLDRVQFTWIVSTAVPLPTPVALGGAGLLALAARRRRPA